MRTVQHHDDEEKHHIGNLRETICKSAFEKGYAEKKFEAAARYFRRGKLVAEEAASELMMTLAEFLEKTDRTE